MNYRVQWTDADGKPHRLEFLRRDAAISKYDRAVEAGATWARVASIPAEPFKEPVVYFEHSECGTSV